MFPELQVSDLVHYLRKQEVILICGSERAEDYVAGLRSEDHTQADVPMLLQELIQDEGEVSLFPEHITEIVPKVLEGLDISIPYGELKTEALDPCVRWVVGGFVLLLLEEELVH